MSKQTEFEKFLESRGIDNFEYEKIVAGKKQWDLLLKRWEEWKGKKGKDKPKGRQKKHTRTDPNKKSDGADWADPETLMVCAKCGNEWKLGESITCPRCEGVEEPDLE